MAIANFSSTVQVEYVTDKLCDTDFAFEYWAYLAWRKSKWNETLNSMTIQAQLEFLNDEPDPAKLMFETRRNGNKSLRPLEKWARDEYDKHKPKKRYSVRVHRADRDGSKTEICDTVYTPRSKLEIGKSKAGVGDDGSASQPSHGKNSNGNVEGNGKHQPSSAL